MNVLCATDGSASAGDAEQLLASLAWPRDARLTILNVEELIHGDWAIPPDRLIALRIEVQRALDARIDGVRDALAAKRRTAEIVRVSGDPADVIVREARRLEADLIIVGSRGHGAIASALLGSVAASVVDNAPCPVLVARTPRLTSLVLAHDGSDGSREAEQLLQSAPYLAELPVTIVSAYGYLPYYTVSEVGSVTPMDPTIYQQIIDDELAQSTRIVNDAAARIDTPTRVVSTSVREGYPPQVILETAAAVKADCIVIGSRGNTGIRRLVLGSVARSVLFNAPCSVLIVRPVVARVSGREHEEVAVSA